MKKLFFRLAAILSLFSSFSSANVPVGFSWVNIEKDASTMKVVRRVLHDTSTTAIREVGVKDGFALVMTTSREADAPTPDYDRWSIYSVSLSAGKSQLLVSGYGVKLLDWIGTTQDELAITYYDCWECEAATVFTTLRFTTGLGWRARWPSKTQDAAYPQPGVVVSLMDVGEPYDDDEVDQVFAVVSQPNSRFAVGRWLHSRNTKTENVDNEVERYSVDPLTNADRVETLNGQAALDWQRQLCSHSNILLQPSTGQDSKSCKAALRTPASRRARQKQKITNVR